MQMNEKKNIMIETNQKLEDDLNKKKKYQERETTSRLIVFNVPTYFTEQKLADHFKAKGSITDCKIKRKGDKSRKFAFIGFKNEEEAKAAKEYFNNSYIDTAQIKVEFAKTHDDPNLPRGWSKYTKGTLAYDRLHPDEPKEKKKPMSQVEAEERKDVDNKKKKFREFVKVMMAKTQKTKSQSWNESFNNFIPTDVTKSRRERKKEERELKEQQKWEEEEKKQEDLANIGKASKITNVFESNNVTIVEKEIHKRSTKLGKNKSKQTHIKFGEKADINEAITKIEDAAPAHDVEQNQRKQDESEDEEVDENRLYIVNLPFSITETELREYFGKYGEIEEVSLPLKKGGVKTGFAFIRFVEPEAAVNAYANLDKKIYQGRIISITPASRKKEKPVTEETKDQQKNEERKDKKKNEQRDGNMDEGSSFKTKKKMHLKRNFDEETNWNYLFMNQDAVTEAIANKLSLKKGEILNKDDDNLAVRVANIETQIIKETKEWMIENGIDLKAIEGKDNRKECKRSKKIIIIKNLSPKVTIDELKELFERYGLIESLVISPSNTLGIVHYQSESHAEIAMKKLCYYRIHNIPLYLEYAPQFFESHKSKSLQNQSIPENEDVDNEALKKYGNTVFVKNLNFNTSEDKLKKAFEVSKAGKILSVKIVRNKEDGLQSKGYGFIEYEDEEQAKTAIKKLQNTIVDEHVLKLKISRKDRYEAEKKKRLDKLKRKEKQDESYVDNDDMASNKLLIKNLAFQANRKDIQALFKEAGQIKKIRLPKKANSASHRGFGFVEFVTVEDAKNAFETMQHSHLYGRKLVIQWAKKSDDINNIMELRQKAQNQQSALLQSASLNKNKRQKLKEAEDSD